MPRPSDAIVGELIAERSTSLLYRGRDARDGRAVVVKVVLPVDHGGELQRIEREHAIVSAICASATGPGAHPGVVATFGITTVDGMPALLREDFGGRSLDQLAKGPLAIDRLLPLAAGLARALAAVHAAGVVHRDVKPSNVIVREDTGAVKLTDFGVAAAPFLDPTMHDPLHDAGGVVGTLAYLAPEQTGRLDRAVDHRADLYAMGVSLYELLAGRLPFEGRDPLEWIHFHLARKPRPPSEVVATVPEVLSDIVVTLLAKAPEERYQTAEGLRHDLERCLRAWTETGHIEPFPLRENDVTSALRVPQKLYGRAAEIARLGAALAASLKAAQPGVVFVSGPSGIGKSALVRELHAPLAALGGLFASGKFEALRRHVPYVAFNSAMEQLAEQLLATAGPRLAARKEALLAALGKNARALVDAFPPLRAVLGELPRAPSLGPGETQNRFQLVFRAFLRTIASAEHPVLLFLDDMQWADPASLALVEAIAHGSLRAPILIVLAFRENEVDASHAFASTAARLRRAGVRVDDVALGPLDAGTVTQLVADTLHTDDASAAGLGRLVEEKTAGNPFFVNQFLETLHADGLLRFDAGKRRWCWEVAEIDARDITDNVVQLLIERLGDLPGETRETLRLASCVGSTFELDTLAIVRGRDRSVVAADLRPAIERALLLVRREADRTLLAFRHDGVQHAAYALVPPAERAEVRLRMARLLLIALSEEELDAQLFDVVNHLDEGLALIDDPAERDRARVLHERAGRRARAATAHAQARAYLATAVSLLDEDAWETRYDETFSLELDLAECEYLEGSLDSARARFDMLLARARSARDRGRIQYQQMRLYQVAGDYRGAADVAIASFTAFGLAPPSTPEGAAEACVELQREVDVLLAGRDPATLLDAPLLEDARQRAIADLLESSGPPIYMVRPELFPWITLQLLVLSLRHGNCEASCYAYGIYALMRAASMGDVDGGLAFAELAIALNEKLRDVRLRGCMLHLLGDHVNFWKRPFATDLPILDRGFQACLEGGDLIYSNYIAFQMPWHAYEAGRSIDEVWKLTARFAPFAARTNPAVHRTIRFEQQFLRDLEGLTARRGSFEDGSFDEAEAIATIEAAQFGCGIVYRHILTMISRYTFGDLAGALEAGDRAEPVLGAAFSMPMQVSFHVYRALATAAYLRAAAPGTDAYAKRLAHAEADHALLLQWARTCPANFGDKAALVSAELARTRGDAVEAIARYEEARALARTSGHTQYEALACELAASFYLASGAPSIASPLLDDACALYRRWGAAGKVAELEGLPPIARETQRGRTSLGTTTGSGARASFDILSVVKASQSISEQVLLPSLLERLMAIVVEHAGAERGVLLLRGVDASGTSEMVVAAEADVDGVIQLVADAEADAPRSILHAVERTAERVILDDAQVANAFSADPYLVERRPRSILCMPILRHRTLIGMFYLENNLVTRAFSPERMEVLEILAAQTAISIENARLFASSQEAIAVRDEFLSIASHELKTPLTPLKLKLQSLASHVRSGKLAEMPRERLLALATTIDTQLSRLSNLVEGLLDLSRIQSGRLVLDRRPVDLAALAAEVVRRYAGEDAPVRHAAVHLVARAPLHGTWDPLRIEQLVTNLVENALKHAPGAPVTVRVEATPGRARLVVEDRGPGLGADDRIRIFERFVRANQTAVSGLGLGLFIARQIVEAHGGTISVESELGAGARFVVDLPLGDEGAAPAAATRGAA